MKSIVLEIWHFFVANLKASYFGAFLLFLFLRLEKYITTEILCN